jgi:hypothetical protein
MPASRILDPLTCTLCSTVWDRMAQPVAPCSHTPAEWETHWAAVGHRNRWNQIANPGEPPSEAVVKAHARLNEAKDGGPEPSLP